MTLRGFSCPFYHCPFRSDYNCKGCLKLEKERRDRANREMTYRGKT